MVKSDLIKIAASLGSWRLQLQEYDSAQFHHKSWVRRADEVYRTSLFRIGHIKPPALLMMQRFAKPLARLCLMEFATLVKVPLATIIVAGSGH